MSRTPPLSRNLLAVAGIVVLQAVAAIFFIADAIGDLVSDGVGIHIAIESVVAFALLAGVIFGARQLRSLLAKAQRQDEALAVASGALAEMIQQRFSEWQLTESEADVALFALKGYNVAQIAALRESAEGTVRAQLTRVYAKAGVTNRAALVSLFFDELLDVSLI